MLYILIKILVFLPISIMHPCKIYGAKNRPKDKAVLVANHRSNWDIVLYLNKTWRKIKILAKKELFKNKFFGALLRYLGGIEIDREKNDIGAIRKCFDALKKGNHLLIFPEGTRVTDESVVLGEFKGGTALIAIKTQTPIVPIWIERRPRLFRKSYYHVGEPFELSQFYGKKLDEQTMAEADEIVKNSMLALREECLKNKKVAKRALKNCKKVK